MKDKTKKTAILKSRDPDEFPFTLEAKTNHAKDFMIPMIFAIFS